MRHTTAAPSRLDGAHAASTEPAPAEEMSGRVLGIIRAYRMGAAVQARDLCQKPVPKAPPEATPRPARGYIRNGVYHVADTASSRRS